MADLKAFADQLVNLTVKEVNELAQILKDEYGIEPAAAGAVMVAGPAAEAEAVVEKTSLYYYSPKKKRRWDHLVYSRRHFFSSQSSRDWYISRQQIYCHWSFTHPPKQIKWQSCMLKNFMSD